jgi:hypothetical protein
MEDKKKAFLPAIKKVAVISSGLFILAFAGGLAMLAIPLNNYSLPVLTGPFQIILAFPFFTIIFIAVAAFCIVSAIKKPAMWWLMPVGTVVLIIGWLASCKIFLNLIENRMG